MRIRGCSLDRAVSVEGSSPWSQSPPSYVRSESSIHQRVGGHEYLARHPVSVGDDFVDAFVEAGLEVEGIDQLEVVGTR